MRGKPAASHHGHLPSIDVLGSRAACCDAAQGVSAVEFESLRGRLTDSCVGEKQHNLGGCAEGNEPLQEEIRKESCKCL